MSFVDQLLIYGETALASYAEGIAGATESQTKEAFREAGMSDRQATLFDRAWIVLDQSPEMNNGFSAVLLQSRSTGEKVLAIRGTEPSQWGADYITDIVDIAALGSINRMAQYQSLEAYYGQLVSSGKLAST